MGCTSSILSDRRTNPSENNHRLQKNSRSLFCVKNINRNSSDFTQTAHGIMEQILETDPLNQALINPYQKTTDTNDEKEKRFVKKDSIISVTGLSNLPGFDTVQTAVRRATGCATTSTTSRLAHRKSSLALTPEEEPYEPYIYKSSAELKYPNLLPPNPPTRVLLVFPKSDVVCDALQNACFRLQMDVVIVKDADSTIEAFQNTTTGGHHLIIVDGRTPKILDPETIARTIRTSKGSQYTTLVAILRRNVFEKDDTSILSLLDAGYNRCLMESPLVTVCVSELRQIQHSLIRPQNIIATQQVLYAALHRYKEAVIITDDLLRIQYANKSAEHLFDTKVDEIINRSFGDLFQSDVSMILSCTQSNKEFDSQMTVKRKTMESMTVNCHFVPVPCIGSHPTHLLILFNTSLILPESDDVLAVLPSTGQFHQQPQPFIQHLSQTHQPKAEPRGSLHSVRRGSFDIRSVASEGIRRTSLAKLSALPLEAPITKVVSILGQVQESCSPDEARLLDKVMEFLKREGLYSPQMKEMRTDDPVATDLIGALLTQGPTNTMSSRRSSNDSVIRSANRQNSLLLPLKSKGGSIVNDLLSNCLEWDFDIFRLEEITEKRPLVYLGMELFRRFEVFSTLNIDELTCKGWLIVIEAHYHATNTYHNSTHAADVMQATAVFLRQLEKRDSGFVDRIDEATALISAAAHDVDHPGRSSAFLCNSDSSLAILYNDMCVLESHHSALTFKLTLRDDKVNIFKNLDRETYKLVRSIIVDMILATEMTRHFEHLAKFVSIFGAENEHGAQADTDDNQILIRRMLIKCADVSNPARQLDFCVEWARRIAEEYFTQTDEEKRRNLPIVMPMFDRATCSISKSQIGFIEYIIQDMMQAWDGFIDMPELLNCMQFNYSQWKMFEEQGIHTLNDIKAKQVSLTIEKNQTSIAGTQQK